VEEIGGLIVDLIRSARAKDQAGAKAGTAPPASEVLKRFLVGGLPQPAPQARKPGPPPPPPPKPAPPVPAPAAVTHEPPTLLGDFRDGRRFLGAFVVSEALAPPVALRPDRW
jgi:hypothetical protein